MTNDHKLDEQKIQIKKCTNVLTYSSGGPKSKMGLPELKSRCGQRYSSLESLGEYVFLPFLETASILWFRVLLSIFKVSQLRLRLFFHCLPWTLPRPFFICKGSCDYLRPTCVISTSGKLIPSATSIPFAL